MVSTFALSAQADAKYADPAGRFTVAVPEKWASANSDTQQIAVVLGKLEGTELQALCVVVVSETPQTVGKSQAEIDDAMNTILTKEFWQSTYKTQGAKDVAVSNVGTRDVPGRKVNYVYAEMTTKGQGGLDQHMKAREEVHALPGRMHDIGCLAPQEKYAAAEADINSILLSYMPLSGLVAQAPATQTPNSMLTLYANAGFAGAARVLKSETPNITYVSWPTVTGSAIVSGFGEWQVCEGADFTGSCTILTGAHTAPEHSLLRIGSVRPLTTSLNGIASSVSTSSMQMLNEALKKLSRKQ